MTATQMRATLMYLAPFLQPCKNVVTSNTPSQIKTRAQSKLQQSLDNEHEDTAEAKTTKSSTTTLAALQQHQTHVARNRLNSNRNNHNNAINSNSTIIINNKNKNTSYRPCCSNNMISYDLTCNQEECICNVSKSSSCSTITTTTTSNSSSSCCHNKCMQHEKFLANFEHQEGEKQIMEQNLQQKDNFYKKYEKPALETTTTTVFSSSNNKLRQKQLKENKPSSAATSLLSTSTSTTSSSSSILSSTSFVNYTNNRSTKYLRERGRRNILQQQEQTLKQNTHGSILKRQQQPPTNPLQLEALMQHNVSYNVKDDEQMEDTNTDIDKQRNLTCGRDPCYKLAKDHLEKQQDTTNIKSNNTSVLSRCHFYNQHNNYNNNSNTIMLSNVQDIMMPQQQELLENMNTLMSHIINCDDHQSDYAQNHNNNYNIEEAGVLKENINLRLTKNSQSKEVVVQNEELKNSYINYKEILFYTNPKTQLSTQSQSFSSTNPLHNHLTSYTTILNNKECRCFKYNKNNNNNKRDTIGSESNNLDQKNFKLLPGIVEATTGHSDNYFIINNKHITSSKISPSTICENLCEIMQLGAKLISPVGQGSNLYKTVAVSKWLFMWLLFLMLSTSVHCWAGRNDGKYFCYFLKFIKSPKKQQPIILF